MAVAINRNVIITSVARLLDEEERKKKQSKRSIRTRPWLKSKKVVKKKEIQKNSLRLRKDKRLLF